jgi:hypothetical protein
VKEVSPSLVVPDSDNEVTENNYERRCSRLFPQQISTVLQLKPTAKFCKTLIMAMKQRGLELNLKLEIISLCQISSSRISTACTNPLQTKGSFS